MIQNILSSSLSLTPRAAPRTHGGNMICVFSHPSAGKSWIAVALATLLAQNRKKTLLFDADLGLTNIDRQLAILPPRGIDNVLKCTAPLNTLLTKRDFDVIAGRSSRLSLPGLSAGALELIKDDLLLLCAHYDAVVTDLGSNEKKALRFFGHTIGTLLLMASRDQTSLTTAARFVKNLYTLHLGADVRLVINNVSSKDEGEQIYQTLLTAVKETTAKEPPLAGVILTDSHVKKAIEAKKSVPQAFPNAQACEDVREILNNLL